MCTPHECASIEWRCTHKEMSIPSSTHSTHHVHTSEIARRLPEASRGTKRYICPSIDHCVMCVCRYPRVCATARACKRTKCIRKCITETHGYTCPSAFRNASCEMHMQVPHKDTLTYRHTCPSAECLSVGICPQRAPDATWSKSSPVGDLSFSSPSVPYRLQASTAGSSPNLCQSPKSDLWFSRHCLLEPLHLNSSFTH